MAVMSAPLRRYQLMFRILFRNRGLGVNLLAGLSFLLLAVYGWGLSWETLIDYLLIIIVLFALLIFIAAVLAWCVRKWSQSRKADEKEKGRQ